MNVVDIYTDGACSGNPGDGGYAYVILFNNRVLLKSSGCSKNTTNNNMELKAIVKSLQQLKEVCHVKKVDLVVVHSDSAYCINPVVKGWLSFWKNNDWMTKKDEPIKNVELWKQLSKFMETTKYKVKFEKVKGHSGDEYNEMVDKAAKRAILRLNDLQSLPSKEAQR